MDDERECQHCSEFFDFDPEYHDPADFICPLCRKAIDGALDHDDE